jgi:uncharacterized protein YecE (DUF72 family)
VNTFLNRAKRLENKLGVILIQLPPSLQYNDKILQNFLRALRSGCQKQKVQPRFALEPRHPTWFMPDNAPELLRAARDFGTMCLVFPHSAKIPSLPPTDEHLVADFTYVRFHGPSEFAASRYGPKRLKPWAERIEKWRRGGLTNFVYFNNDIHGHAIVDARTLRRQLRDH